MNKQKRNVRLSDRLSYFFTIVRNKALLIYEEVYTPIVEIRFQFLHSTLIWLTKLIVRLLKKSDGESILARIVKLPATLLICAIFLPALFLISTLLILIGGTLSAVLGQRNLQDYSLMEKVLMWAPIIILLLVFPWLGSEISIYRVQMIMCFMIIILGLNIIYSECGIFSLGHGAFVLLGAYFTCWFSNGAFGIAFPTLIGIFLAGIVCSIFGFLLGAPALRIKDHYLVILTLAFGHLIPIILKSRYLLSISGFQMGGLSMKKAFPSYLSPYLKSEIFDFYNISLVVLILVFFSYNLLHHSQVGKAFRALKCQSEVASIFGVSNVKYKLMAFSLSAAYAGFAGGLMMIVNPFVSPDSYTSSDSSAYLTGAVLGGKGILGTLLGAGYLLFEQDMSRLAVRAIPKGEQLLSVADGIILILAVYLAPEGLGKIITSIFDAGKLGQIRRWHYLKSPPPDYDLINRKTRKDFKLDGD